MPNASRKSGQNGSASPTLYLLFLSGTSIPTGGFSLHVIIGIRLRLALPAFRARDLPWAPLLTILHSAVVGIHWRRPFFWIATAVGFWCRANLHRGLHSNNVDMTLLVFISRLLRRQVMVKKMVEVPAALWVALTRLLNLPFSSA
jgi:hypothetical protein